MKITNSEKRLVNNRRKFIKIKRRSEKIISYRKGSKESKGEKKISEFLISEKIIFKREYYFKGLYNYNKTQLLYFDFYIYDFNLCIEFDGQQHFRLDKTDKEKANDFIKNAFCAKNGINFLRIKYNDIDNVESIICKKVDSISPI